MSKKGNPANLFGIRVQNVLLGQIEHPLTAIHAIDSEERLALQKLGQKSSIPLTHNQGASGRTEFAQTSHPRLLQGITESDGLEDAIPRRDGIEAHSAETSNATTGVRSTKSANAVRSSIPKERRFIPRSRDRGRF